MHTEVCTVIDLPNNVQLVCCRGAVFAKHRGWRSVPRSCRILYTRVCVILRSEGTMMGRSPAKESLRTFDKITSNCVGRQYTYLMTEESPFDSRLR
jgi:hypothetical protein